MTLFSFPARVNERAARLVAAAVAVSLGAAMALELRWAVAVLAAGFLLRVGWGPRFSPLGRLAMALALRLGEPVPVAGSPKRFAQAIGATFTLAASALFLTGYGSAGWAVVGLVIVFAVLEAGVAFCAGCWVYRQGQRLGVFAPEVCVDCAPGPR
jgi:hypothetical protein